MVGAVSRVHAAVDMFGPVDLVMLHDINRELAAKPGYRWSDVMETHEGALLGGDPATLRERCQAASRLIAFGRPCVPC